MKSKAKTKNLSNDSSQDGGCYGDDIGNNRPGPSPNGQGLRRSTRKRSAPKEFVVKNLKKFVGYWTTEEKEKLLKVLGELNSRQLGSSSSYRYPFPVIRKRIRSKSLKDTKCFLAMLEKRGAVRAFSQMKQQPPIESWRQMADNLTVLTSDNCSRHLIRVCSVMALECKEDEHGSASKGSVHDEDIEITPASTPASTPATPATPATATWPPSALPTGSAERTRVGITPTTPTSRILTCQATETSTTTVASHSASSASARPIEETPALNTAAAAAAAASAARENDTAAAAAESHTAESQDLQLAPDYASIYKYIGRLMQGEQKELGPLESLIVLDCLNLVEEHLKGRNNTAQKAFSQERFLDILNNFHHSIDIEDAGKNQNVVTEELVTVADLLGRKKNPSESDLHQADQSVSGLPLNGQSENSSTVDMATNNVECSREGEVTNQSEETLLPGDQSASSKRVQQKTFGLGSLNPFGIPIRLLEIRKDR